MDRGTDVTTVLGLQRGTNLRARLPLGAPGVEAQQQARLSAASQLSLVF
jgi:hypothetical protein